MTRAAGFGAERFARAFDRCIAGLPAPPASAAVAFSGGLDSTVLLHATAGLGAARGFRVRAIHVDHALQPQSPAWARDCVKVAARLGIACSVVRVDARGAAGESPEAAARDARYRALAERLESGEVLLTAHHADDQLETVLLQMLRGGGARATAGMAATQPFGRGWHARPLLEFERKDLERYAERAALTWITDPSNASAQPDRNYLRHAVVPVLRERWPAAATTVGRVARLTRETIVIAAELTRHDLVHAQRGAALSLVSLATLPAPRQRATIRAWLALLGLPLPNEAQLEALMSDSSRAAGDRVPCTDWPGAAVYRYRSHLHAVAVRHAAAGYASDWTGLAPLAWPHGGRVELVPAAGQGLSTARLTGPLRVATRAGGEKFAQADKPRALGKWLLEHGVLPWQRDRLPLLWCGDHLVAVADLACAREAAAAPGESSVRVVWHERPVVTEGDAFGYTALPS